MGPWAIRNWIKVFTFACCTSLLCRGESDIRHREPCLGFRLYGSYKGKVGTCECQDANQTTTVFRNFKIRTGTASQRSWQEIKSMFLILKRKNKHITENIARNPYMVLSHMCLWHGARWMCLYTGKNTRKLIGWTFGLWPDNSTNKICENMFEAFAIIYLIPTILV